MGRKTGYMSVSIDAEYDITVEGVVRFIENHATEDDMTEIRKAIGSGNAVQATPVVVGLPRTIIDDLTDELLNEAKAKFTYEQLMDRLK